MVAKLNADRVLLRVRPDNNAEIGLAGEAWEILVDNQSGGPIHHIELVRVNAINPNTREMQLDVPGLPLDLRPQAGPFALENGKSLGIRFKPMDRSLINSYHPFVRLRFTDSTGHMFRSAYRPGQSGFGGLTSVWVYEGMRRDAKTDLIDP